MVTRNDVARRANVSPAVVSYVINNSNYVSKEKREAVLQAIRELNYIPNQNAKNLRQGRTRMIAVIRGSQLNDMFNDVLFHMEDAALASNYQISSMSVLKTKDYFATDDFIETIISRHYDAVFVVNSSLTENQVNRLSQYTKVLLYCTRDYYSLSEHISTIIPDYQNGIRAAVNRLIDLGHRRISFLPNLGYPRELYTPTNHRYIGYVNALADHGLEPDLLYIPGSGQTLADIEKHTLAMFNPLITPLPPTAICTDEPFVMAYVLKVLNRLGLRVPEDVSLLCFSHSFISSITTPTLTGIGFDHKEFAKTSMEMIQDLIHGGSARSEVIPLDYIGGGSVAPPPDADRSAV